MMNRGFANLLMAVIFAVGSCTYWLVRPSSSTPDSQPGPVRGEQEATSDPESICRDVQKKIANGTSCSASEAAYFENVERCREFFIGMDDSFENLAFAIGRCYTDAGEDAMAQAFLNKVLARPNWEDGSPGGCHGHDQIKALLDANSRAKNGKCLERPAVEADLSSALESFAPENLERFLEKHQPLMYGHDSSDAVCHATFGEIQNMLGELFPRPERLVIVERSELSRDRLYFAAGPPGTTGRDFAASFTFQRSKSCYFLDGVFVRNSWEEKRRQDLKKAAGDGSAR